MFLDYKVWLALLAVFLTVFAYAPYLRGIFLGTTRPHFFTWIIWSSVTLIASVIQFAKGGASGAWPTSIAAILCFWVAYLSIKRGSRDVRKVDWYFLFAGLGALPLWIITKDPTWSALLVTGIEILASFSTIRKSWSHPDQEVALTFGVNT